jgi:hypothetical protein
MSCPVCFNAATSDETVRTSLNLGIFVLMGVTTCVLAGFLRFIISIARRSRADLKVGLYDDRARSTDGEAGLQAGLGI